MERTKSLEIAVESTLHELSIPINTKGYRYIKEAVLRLISCEGSGLSIVEEIYGGVGDCFSVGSKTVERNIRYSKETAWKSSSKNISEMLNYKTKNLRAPKNAEFLYLISEHVKNNKSA